MSSRVSEEGSRSSNANTPSSVQGKHKGSQRRERVSGESSTVAVRAQWLRLAGGWRVAKRAAARG